MTRKLVRRMGRRRRRGRRRPADRLRDAPPAVRSGRRAGARTRVCPPRAGHRGRCVESSLRAARAIDRTSQRQSRGRRRRTSFSASRGDPPCPRPKSLPRCTLPSIGWIWSGPRLTIVRHANGTTNLPRGRSASGDAAPLDLGMVSVNALSIALADESTGREVAIGPLDLSLDTSPRGSQPGAFGPSPFSVRLPAPRSQPITLSGHACRQARLRRRPSHGPRPAHRRRGRPARRYADSSTWAERSAPRHARAAGRGRCASGATDAASLTPAGVADAANIQGTVEVVLTARGSVASPTLDLAATGDGLAYGLARGRPARRPSHRSAETVSSSSARPLVAVGLPARERRDRLARSGRLRKPATGASRLAVRWTDVDLDRALESAGYTLPASIGARASGRAELRLRSAAASVDDLLSRLAADASVSLQPIRDASSAWRQSGPRRAGPTPLEGRLVVRTTLADGQPFVGIARGHPHRTHSSRAERLDARRQRTTPHRLISGRRSRGLATPACRFQSSTAAT